MKLTKEEIIRFNKTLEMLGEKESNRDLLICEILDNHVDDHDVENHQGFENFITELKDRKIIFIPEVLISIYYWCLGEKQFQLPIWVQVRLAELTVDKYPTVD
jgi:hypothetical protein